MSSFQVGKPLERMAINVTGTFHTSRSENSYESALAKERGCNPVTPIKKRQLLRDDPIEMIQPHGTMIPPALRDPVLPLSSGLDPAADQ